MTDPLVPQLALTSFLCCLFQGRPTKSGSFRGDPGGGSVVLPRVLFASEKRALPPIAFGA
jgi:hypothetical protein